MLLSFILRPSAKIAVLGYYGLNVKSIIKKYCINKDKPKLKCHGKCYLKSKLQFSTSTTSTEVNNINFIETFIPVFLPNSINYSLDIFRNEQKINPIIIHDKLFDQFIFFKIEYPPEYS